MKVILEHTEILEALDRDEIVEHVRFDGRDCPLDIGGKPLTVSTFVLKLVRTRDQALRVILLELPNLEERHILALGELFELPPEAPKATTALLQLDQDVLEQVVLPNLEGGKLEDLLGLADERGVPLLFTLDHYELTDLTVDG